VGHPVGQAERLLDLCQHSASLTEALQTGRQQALQTGRLG